MQSMALATPASFPTRVLVAYSLAALAISAFAQDRTTEAGEAAITDPNVECTAYPYFSQLNTTSANTFPAVWTNATIVPGDSEAMSKWGEIAPNVPTNIPTHGVWNNALANISYDIQADPDCWWTIGEAGHKCNTPKHPGLPNDVWFVPEPLTVGYGFDDGPNCSHNAFYDFLSQNSQKATMYFIGSNVMNWPLEAQRALTDGHEICVHTWSHPYMTSKTNEDAFAELFYTMRAIKLVTGVTPTCWRPPYGDVDDRIRSIAHNLGLRTISWGFDSNDWQYIDATSLVTDADVDGFYQNFVNNATSGAFNAAGAIILTHEIRNYTMQKAIEWYPKLKAAFSHIVPVGVALNQTQPYVETNYSLPTFEQYVAGYLTASPSNASSPPSSGSTGNSSGSTGSSGGSTGQSGGSGSPASGGSSNDHSGASMLAVSLCVVSFATILAAASVF